MAAELTWVWESSFVINNNGYTIERLIHGMDASYNDITPWQHTLLLQLFGAPAAQQRSYQVRTKKELEELLTNDEFNSTPVIQVGLLPPPFSDDRMENGNRD